MGLFLSASLFSSLSYTQAHMHTRGLTLCRNPSRAQPGPAKARGMEGTFRPDRTLGSGRSRGQRYYILFYYSIMVLSSYINIQRVKQTLLSKATYNKYICKKKEKQQYIADDRAHLIGYPFFLYIYIYIYIYISLYISH